MTSHLGLKAALRGTFDRGSLKLSFSSREEFARILMTLGLTMKQ